LDKWRARSTDGTVRPTVLSKYFLLTDRHWAQNVIEASGLLTSSDRHKVVIFHVNPGCGVLIESLLELCDHMQIACEPSRLYHDYLRSLEEAYSTKFVYCRGSFVNDSQLEILDKLFTNDGRASDAGCHAKIVGSVSEQSLSFFITKLLLLLSGCCKIRSYQIDVIEPILIVTGCEYRLMTETESMWRKTKSARPALYELFFRIELLQTVPLSAFNHAKQHPKLITKLFDYDQENLYVVRLSLREDLDLVYNHKDMIGVMLLLRVISVRKAQRIIPAMERMFPDIGAKLLECGISMMDRFHDVSLSVWPKIYHTVSSSSEFSCSPLYYIFQRDSYFSAFNQEKES